MLKNLLVVLCFLIAGCAAKRDLIPMMPIPADGTREALLLDFQPSGTPCLDAIIVNFLNIGCSSVGTIQRPEYQGILLGCYSPQPGAMDLFSNASFVYSRNPMLGDPLLDIGEPFCADMAGVYAVLPASIGEYGEDNN